MFAIVITEQNVFGKIYRITNLINGKVYIGQAINKNSNCRFYQHVSASKRSNCDSYNTRLSRTIRKYGREQFISEIICFCDSKESMDIAEVELIKSYSSRNHSFGYNISAGGDGTVGVIPSNETRRKQSLSHLGHSPSAETRSKMSLSRMRRPVSEETRNKLSISNSGIKKPSLIGNKHAAGNKSYLKRTEKRGADHPCSTKIVQLNAGLGFIKEWGSVADIIRELKINNISRGIDNQKRMPGGYRWMKLTSYNLIINGNTN
jgi:group I intron endonuclease